jgi:hypothetical protein
VRGGEGRSVRDEAASVPGSSAQAFGFINKRRLFVARTHARTHARTRMRKRSITSDQVLEVLRRGSIAPGENPAPDIYGNWKATLRKNVAGEEVNVAAALDKGVVVITVY